MSQLLAIVYDTPETARRAADRARRLGGARLLKLRDVIIMQRSRDGRIMLDHSIETDHGAVLVGAILGGMIGCAMLAPMVGILSGVALGSVCGLLFQSGIDDRFIREMSAGIAPGKAVLCVMADAIVMDRVVPVLGEEGGTLLYGALASGIDDLLTSTLVGLQGTGYRANHDRTGSTQSAAAV